MEIKENELRQGKTISATTRDKDDLRTAELSFSPRTNMFAIWFNGEIIHLSKTIRPMLKRFETLKEKWNLEFDAS